MRNKLLVVLLPVLFTVFVVGCAAENTPQQYQYEYEQTRELVAFVEQAAEYFHTEGEEAFPEFTREGSKWFEGDRYIFIYDLDGINILHPVEEGFEGKNMIDVKDINGRPVIKMIVDIARNEDKPYGWIDGCWVRPGQIFPNWKTAYIVRVEDPSGKAYALGSGLYDMKMELQFIASAVDSTAELIEKEGEAAFATLRSPSSQYNFGSSLIFAISMDGTAIVDPGYPTMEGRNLLDYTDAVGNYMIRDMIEALKTDDSAWVMFMQRKPHEIKPSRKLAYVRKVEMEDRTIIVGSSFFLKNPIWMR